MILQRLLRLHHVLGMAQSIAPPGGGTGGDRREWSASDNRRCGSGRLRTAGRCFDSRVRGRCPARGTGAGAAAPPYGWCRSRELRRRAHGPVTSRCRSTRTPASTSIDYLRIADRAGNTQYYPGFSRVPEGPNDLKLDPNDDPSFTVTGTPATRTRKPAGSLSAFAIRPASVDTTSAPRWVRVVARFKGASQAMSSSSSSPSGSRAAFTSCICVQCCTGTTPCGAARCRFRDGSASRTCRPS